MRIRAGMLVAAALALAPASRAHAGAEGAATTGAAFLTRGPGGAAAGMGGASLAFGADLAGATWNPAALGGLGGLEVAFAHAGMFDESQQEWVALGGSTRARSWHWSLAGLFVHQDPFDGRDASGQPTGSFTAGSAAFSGSLARSLGAAGALGVTTRWVNERLAEVNGSGIAFDAGLRLHRGMLGFGAGAQNLGSMRYGGSSYPMPASWGAGVSLRHPAGLGVAVDFNVPRAYYQDVRAGLEYRWRDLVALRGGYRRELGSDPTTESLTGPTFGLGAGSRGWWLDYAYLPANLGSAEQRIAVSFAPGRAAGAGGAFGAGAVHGASVPATEPKPGR